MKSIKQTITALTAEDSPKGVRVSREEKEPMSDKRFFAVLGCIVKVTAIVAIAKVVPQIDNYKLFILGAIIVILTVAYFIYDKGI